MSKMVTKKVTLSQGQKISDFLQAAYSDYISARILILSDQLVNGCNLANTSIEKYFKAYKCLLNENIPRHHDITIKKYRNTFKNKFPTIYESINFEFIEFLFKSYLLRYLDDIPDDFNLVIIKNKTLAELDHIVNILENSISINRNGRSGRKYKTDLDENNNALLNYNFLLSKIDKSKFVESVNFIYELRKIPNFGIIEVTYYSDKVNNDGKFNYEGYKPLTPYPASQFQLSFHPVQ